MDLPIEHGDFPVRYVNVYQRVFGDSRNLAFNGKTVEFL